MRALLPAFLLLSCVAAIAQDPPKREIPISPGVETVHSQLGNWFPAGSNPGNYTFGMESVAGGKEQEAFFIKPKPGAEGLPGFGTLMQMHDPGEWRGKRVRMSARLKTVNTRRAQMWLRVDRPDRSTLSNMDERPISGTTDWRVYEIVMDVPQDAIYIAYGFFLAYGEGAFWGEGFTLEEVDKSVRLSRSATMNR